MREVVRHVVDDLVQRQLLELSPGATPDAVVEAVLAQIEAAPAFAQAGSTIARALIECDCVAEVYAEDEQILETLNHISG